VISLVLKLHHVHVHDEAEEYNIGLLRKFVGLFPMSPLSKVILGYMYCSGIPLPVEAVGEDGEDEKLAEMDYEDGFQLPLVCVFLQKDLEWIADLPLGRPDCL